ncbi:MAG: aminotransferase class V-fold PLP-dependent enzyme [Candidatus Latescibacterota bacterium]|nr:aminotransferase class V-fold PLP-dependent enzyme [Candidatus Latescibacterota bacterium]
MDLHKKYELRRVINACGKMTHLGGAIVLPEIAEAASEAMRHFFELDELQAAAGRVIAEASGADSGCVTACTAAGITLSVAATMTGTDLAKVYQLPDTDGMADRVLIQKGHCVNYGQPITQAIRLAGAQAVEVGVVNRCSEAEMRHELDKGGITAIVHVESHHTVRFGWVKLSRVTVLAREYGVPLIVDGAAQDLRLRQLISEGADMVIVSAHKFYCSTTGGVVAGRKDLVDSMYLQNRGIGRPMKAGKEAIVGAMVAIEYRAKQDMAAWKADQDRKVERILDHLKDVTGLELGVDPDPNGCPFSRAKLIPDPDAIGHTAVSLSDALAEGDPIVVARSHHAEEGYIYLDAIEMTDDEIDLACARVRSILAG